MKKALVVLSLCLSSCTTDNTVNTVFIPNLGLPTTTEAFSAPQQTNVQVLDLREANVTYLTTEVTAESVNVILSAMEKFNELNNDPIYLIIDTPGGSVMDGGRLITAIQTSKNPVYAIDTGLAASMGFMILEHSHKRLAVPKAILMAHPASIGVQFQGELDKAVSRLSFLKSVVDKMDHYISARAQVTYEAFKIKSSREFWMDSEDALANHYLDGIVAVKLPAAGLFGLGNNKLRDNIRME